MSNISFFTAEKNILSINVGRELTLNGWEKERNFHEFKDNFEFQY